MTQKENMKLSIRLIGLKIVVVFVPFFSKLMLRRTMQTKKQCHTLTLLSFQKEELAKTDSMKDVKTYKNFVRSLKIVVFSQNAFNTCDEFDECFNDDLLEFL